MTGLQFHKTKEFLEQEFGTRNLPKEIFLLDGRWALAKDILVPIFHDDYLIFLDEVYVESAQEFENKKIYFLNDVFEGIFFRDKRILLELRLASEINKFRNSYIVLVSKDVREISGVFVDPILLSSKEYSLARYILWGEKLMYSFSFPRDKYLRQKIFYLLKLHNISIEEDVFTRLNNVQFSQMSRYATLGQNTHN